MLRSTAGDGLLQLATEDKGAAMTSRWGWMLVIALVGASCSDDDDPIPSAADPTTTATPDGATSDLVGSWVGVHECDAIVDALRSAGVEESVVLENVVGNGLVPGAATPADLADPANPCVDAVPREHGHFFTELGEFGSTDYNGDQVDDGSYEIIDDDTVSINGTEFGFTVEGDELTLQPPPVTTDCSDFECQWSIMVAMPGQILTRAE
jgi:hypothetical protein